MRVCAGYEAEFGDKSLSWSLLDGYYIPTRYPNELPDGIPADVYTRTAAEQAVALASEVVEYVRARLRN